MRRVWWAAAIAALAVAVIDAWIVLGTEPLRTRLLYPGYVAISASALWLGIGLIAVGSVALLLWFFAGLASEGARWKPPALAGVLILISGIGLCAASFPALLTRLQPEASINAGAHRYELAYFRVATGDNVFALYECDRAGLLCDVRYISAIYPETDPPAEAALFPSADGSTVDILINGETIRRHPVRFD
jgi:hypothetical protein